MAEFKNKTIVGNIAFGENKEEVSDQEHQSNSKIKPEAKPEENRYTKYELLKEFWKNQDGIETQSTIGGYTKLIYKSPENVYAEVKHKSNIQENQEESEEIVDNACKNAEEVSDAKKVPLRHENSYSMGKETSNSQEYNIDMANKKEKKICKPEEVQHEIHEHAHRTEKDTETDQKIIFECLKCRCIKEISDRSQRYIKEISEAKTLIENYKSQVDRLEKENANTTTLLNSLCAEIKINRPSAFPFRLNNLFSGRRKPASTSMTEQFKQYMETIRKDQINSKLFIEKQFQSITTLQKENSVLKQKLNCKNTLKKSKVRKVSCPETFRNLEDLNIELDRENSSEYKLQIKGIQQQIDGILQKLEGSGANLGN